MNQNIRKKKKAFVDEAHCVAGSCVKVCPTSAIQVWQGITARVAEAVCVGCGKCARECPASVIRIQEVNP